jgi:hypothetical protein
MVPQVGGLHHRYLLAILFLEGTTSGGRFGGMAYLTNINLNQIIIRFFIYYKHLSH